MTDPPGRKVTANHLILPGVMLIRGIETVVGVVTKWVPPHIVTALPATLPGPDLARPGSADGQDCPTYSYPVNTTRLQHCYRPTPHLVVAHSHTLPHKPFTPCLHPTLTFFIQLHIPTHTHAFPSLVV